MTIIGLLDGCKGSLGIHCRQRAHRVVVIATDRYAPMAETPAAHLQGVGHVGQVKIRIFFEVLDQVLGDLLHCSATLSGEDQQLPRS
jgi:hypothetical protein